MTTLRGLYVIIDPSICAGRDPVEGRIDVLWLGRAYGRRAETSNPFSAPGFAT